MVLSCKHLRQGGHDAQKLIDTFASPAPVLLCSAVLADDPPIEVFEVAPGRARIFVVRGSRLAYQRDKPGIIVYDLAARKELANFKVNHELEDVDGDFIVTNGKGGEQIETLNVKTQKSQIITGKFPAGVKPNSVIEMSGDWFMFEWLRPSSPTAKQLTHKYAFNSTKKDLRLLTEEPATDCHLAGNIVVWCGAKGEDRTLYMYDLSTSKQTTVAATPPAILANPATDGRRIVWTETFPRLYDISSGETVMLLDGKEEKEEVRQAVVSGDWVGFSGSNSGVRAMHLPTRKIFTIKDPQSAKPLQGDIDIGDRYLVIRRGAGLACAVLPDLGGDCTQGRGRVRGDGVRSGKTAPYPASPMSTGERSKSAVLAADCADDADFRAAFIRPSRP